LEYSKQSFLPVSSLLVVPPSICGFSGGCGGVLPKADWLLWTLLPQDIKQEKEMPYKEYSFRLEYALKYKKKRM